MAAAVESALQLPLPFDRLALDTEFLNDELLGGEFGFQFGNGLSEELRDLGQGIRMQIGYRQDVGLVGGSLARNSSVGRTFLELGKRASASDGLIGKWRRKNAREAAGPELKNLLGNLQGEIADRLQLLTLYAPAAKRRVFEAVALELHDEASDGFAALAAAEADLVGVWRDALGMPASADAAEVRRHAAEVELVADGEYVKPLEAAVEALRKEIRRDDICSTRER